MNKELIKKTGALLLALTIICCSMLFTACGGEKEGNGGSESTKAIYKVTVKDAVGNPYTAGVIVKFLKDGKQVAMQNVNAEGVAEKELEKGNYTVDLMITSGESIYFDKTDLSLSAEKTELEIIMAKTADEATETLFAHSIIDGESKDHKAFNVETGSTYVTLTAGERNYFIFTPKEPGKYEFSFTGAEGTVGYYGAPHFVQQNSSAEVVDGKFSVSIKASMISTDTVSGTTRLVVGVDAGADVKGGFLSVIRVGDPDWTIEDEPWTVYPTPQGLETYTLPEGALLVDFDLSAAGYTLVLNETDGYYHLNTADGPLVLVRLAEDSKYITSFKKILETIGVNKYFFNEDGTFVKKESYVECLNAYIGCVDETKGVYPLNDDLKYIIQQYGDHMGWWDSDRTNGSYLFIDENGNKLSDINEDIAWLLMCCYIA